MLTKLTSFNSWQPFCFPTFSHDLFVSHCLVTLRLGSRVAAHPLAEPLSHGIGECLCLMAQLISPPCPVPASPSCPLIGYLLSSITYHPLGFRCLLKPCSPCLPSRFFHFTAQISASYIYVWICMKYGNITNIDIHTC